MANIKDAVYFIDDISFYGLQRGLNTAWDYLGDGEGPLPATAETYFLLNSDKEGEVTLKRDCHTFQDGLLTFEMLFQNLSGDGFFLAFGSRTDAFLKLVTKGEALFIENTKVADLPYGQHYIKLYMNLTSAKVTVMLDAVTQGEFDFNQPVFPFNCIRMGYGENAKGSAGVYFSKLYVNYLVNDLCLNPQVGSLPDEYTVKAPKGSSVTNGIRVAGKKDCTYISKNKNGAKTITQRTFDKASGMVVFEALYLMDAPKGKVTISLGKGSKNVVTVYDEGEALCLPDGTVLRPHHLNVWQTLRIYADTNTNRATIWLNGKKTQTVDFEVSAKYVDNFQILYEAYEESSLMFSDFRLWIQPEEPADYVPAPVVPKKRGDHVVGMNICSLWREGYHYGWDCISPFDECTPVLGFYDEGLPETADWEIKYMAEHGIDYELYCWYSSEQSAPIKTTLYSSAWRDGHFYAKYADYEKIGLLWEAANCQHPTCLEDFKANLVPYWLDYFFSDPRYVRVDNKAFMSCFGVWAVKDDLGGAEKVREGLAYLREEVKKLGYDDLIVMGCHADPVLLQELGFDAFHAYHWGYGDYTTQYNIDCNQARMDAHGVHIVPTVSVGYKEIGWNGDRSPNLPCQDMYDSLIHCIENILPQYESGWQSKLLHLSTWNEFGEGTYIMPSGLNGFGYLDAIRKALCEDIPHADLVPTQEQKARIGYLYPPKRYRLQRTKFDDRPLPAKEKAVAKFTFQSEADLKKWNFINIEQLEIRDGVLYGTAVGGTPIMELKKPNIDASRIAYGKIVCTNRTADKGLPTEIKLLTSNVQDKDNYTPGEHGFYSGWCTSLERKEYRFDLDTQSSWTNTIRHFRFIPTTSGQFQIESIILYAAAPHLTLYGKDGRQVFFGDYLPEINGQAYIPLDPADNTRNYMTSIAYSRNRPRHIPYKCRNGVFTAIGYEYEWHKEEGRLELWNKTDRVTVVVGKVYVVRNGESYILERPVFLKDGIPTISLRDFEKIFAVTAQRIGDKIYLK